MFTRYTAQDWDAYTGDKRDFIRAVIQSYKGSRDFRIGLAASDYFRGDNQEIARKTIVKATTVESEDNGRKRKRLIKSDVPGNRIANGFFFRFVTQQNQHLLANGVTLADAGEKMRLGYGFDKTLERIGEKALQHGVCWGYWNADHLECIPAVDGVLSGFVALLDEFTGTPRIGIQFWQIAPDKPMCVRLFEQDGVTVYREDDDDILQEYEPKRAYIQTVSSDVMGDMVVGCENYTFLPVVPLYANEDKRSELTNSIKAKIDLYDKIISDFGDNLDRANDVYWVLNNFGGNTDDMLAMVKYINELKIVASSNDATGGASAEPKTVDVPYAARTTALDLLKKALYQDYMALDMDALTGGSLTNVAIKAATANLELKCDRYEWQVFQFVQSILKLLGIETEEIRFTRQSIMNDAETVQSIYTMRQDIDLETALQLNPYITQEDIPRIIANHSAESVSGLAGMEQLQSYLDGQGEVNA